MKARCPAGRPRECGRTRRVGERRTGRPRRERRADIMLSQFLPHLGTRPAVCWRENVVPRLAGLPRAAWRLFLRSVCVFHQRGEYLLEVDLMRAVFFAVPAERASWR
eukprot:6566459-Prymnesium_polylepis.1